MKKCLILLKFFPVILVISKSSKKFKLNKKFSFQCVSEATVRKFVKNLLSDKAAAGEIPVNALKNSETCLFKLTNWIEDTHREEAPSNKTPALTKSMNIDLYVVGTSNQLLIRDS